MYIKKNLKKLMKKTKMLRLEDHVNLKLEWISGIYMGGWVNRKFPLYKLLYFKYIYFLYFIILF